MHTQSCGMPLQARGSGRDRRVRDSVSTRAAPIQWEVGLTASLMGIFLELESARETLVPA